MTAQKGRAGWKRKQTRRGGEGVAEVPPTLAAAVGWPWRQMVAISAGERGGPVTGGVKKHTSSAWLQPLGYPHSSEKGRRAATVWEERRNFRVDIGRGHRAVVEERARTYTITMKQGPNKDFSLGAAE